MSAEEGPGEDPLRILAPHEVDVPPVEYLIVIPTRGRWRSVNELSKLRKDKEDRRPFILAKTLGFLQRQGIAPGRVELWTADREEADRYTAVVERDSYWHQVRVRVGVPGIMAQRNHIVRAHDPNKYLVSFDDDVADVLWKDKPGSSRLVQLPAGGLENILFHAYSLMTRHKAFIWGLASTCGRNVLSMSLDGISTRNGEINGFLYGWLNRHDPALQPSISDATEDAERSLRYFAKDKIVLRYRMYCADTQVWKFEGGLQDQFDGSSLEEKNRQRKAAERVAAQALQERFPALTSTPKEKAHDSTLMVHFRPLGKFPIPVTTAAILQAANKADEEGRKSRRHRQPGASSSSSRDAAAVATAGGASSGGEGSQQADATGQAAAAGSVEAQGEGEDTESGSDEVDSDALREAAAENADFQAILAASAAAASSSSSSAGSAGGAGRGGGGGAAAGEVAPMSREEEEEMVRRALEASMQDLDIRINGDCQGDPLELAIQESRAEQDRKRRKLDPSLAALIEMGFPDKDAGQALIDAEGVLEKAIVMLASAAASAA